MSEIEDKRIISDLLIDIDICDRTLIVSAHIPKEDDKDNDDNDDNDDNNEDDSRVLFYRLSDQTLA